MGHIWYTWYKDNNMAKTKTKTILPSFASFFLCLLGSKYVIFGGRKKEREGERGRNVHHIAILLLNLKEEKRAYGAQSNM